MASKLTELLKDCVSKNRCDFLTYGEFGRRYGLGSFPPAWANRRTLDLASRECKSDPDIDKLDLTFLIRSSTNHYPSVIDGLPFDTRNPEPQMATARQVAQEIIDRFAPGTANPY